MVGATLRGRPPLIYAKFLIYNDFSHVTLSSAFREIIKTTGRETRPLRGKTNKTINSNLSTWNDNSMEQRTGKKWKSKKIFQSKIPV